MNILREIVIYKKLEIDERKKEWAVSQLEDMEYFKKPIHSLKKNLGEGIGNGIIAEFKRRSPSKGLINDNASVAEVTRAYTEYGASGLSVLTDEKFFGGFVPDLLKARPNNIPILRKDFIIDEYQIIASKSFGADVILLIAACLTQKKVKDLAKAAKKIGLEVILEVHNEKEIGHYCDDIDMVGVNNRDLKTFEVDINTSLRLFDKLPPGKPAITESGISDVESIKQLKQAGYKGFLMGERFMKEADPGQAFGEFTRALENL